MANGRRIAARRVELGAAHRLAAGMMQYSWKAPARKHGLYRVYLDGQLAAVTQETWYNAMPREIRTGTVIEVFAETQDDRS